MTPELCEDGSQTDGDQDGLSDFCEKNLAVAFAPVFKYSYEDDVSRESYWAARRIGARVRLFYALGYYFDLGTVPPEYTDCKLTLGELFSDCDGHHGDSEWVVLDVRYDGTTGHWVLYQALLSHHEDPLTVSNGSSAYPTMFEYAEHPGGAPIIYVSIFKHANYPTRQTCNDGGGAPWPLVELFPWDDCSSNTLTFVATTGTQRNLGSEQVRWIDCVESENPFYQDPPPVPEECFWTGSRFYGWQRDHASPSASPYSDALQLAGFILP